MYIDFFLEFIMVKEKHAPPGGLEPPTFRLTAERANQLRHGGLLPLQICSSVQLIILVAGGESLFINKTFTLLFNKSVMV